MGVWLRPSRGAVGAFAAFGTPALEKSAGAGFLGLHTLWRPENVETFQMRSTLCPKS
jgi:hypothetical protein